MNICFETFGCRLNRAEALDDEAAAIARGDRIVKMHAHADTFVVRGCSVTARAQRDCERLIEHLRRKYPTKRLIIRGCLPEAEKKKDAEAGKGSAESNGVPTRTARAYLKVQDGCAGQCTFCIVPKFRGASRSEDFELLLDKAKRFIDAGYHEIVVTGCNLALYAQNGKRLPELLAALAQLDARCRIRLGSLEPWGCADEVVDVLGENANICRFLHIPVQSGSDRILKLMNRPYQIADVERLVQKARTRMPTIGLGCDLMTGFPGESEGDFVQTKKLLTHLAFSNAHIFPYSERPGTPAVQMPGLIEKTVRSTRAHKLDAIARATRKRFAKTFVGKTVDVVLESHSVQPKGWTGEYLWFEGPLRPPATLKCVRKDLASFVVRAVDGEKLLGTSIYHGR